MVHLSSNMDLINKSMNPSSKSMDLLGRNVDLLPNRCMDPFTTSRRANHHQIPTTTDNSSNNPEGGMEILQKENDLKQRGLHFIYHSEESAESGVFN
ncbi:hypothetical protein JTB14_037722 [Gonioctena quinquepunctata]|nr:hypothetical protein JTB14_037722 [Gonioctena quinquepunctata]